MKRILFSLILALSLALPAAAQVVEDPSTGASISSGSTISGCNAITAILNVVTGALTCNPASVVNGTVSTAGRSILTIKDTIGSAGFSTDNFFNLRGTLVDTPTTTQSGIYYGISTSAADSGAFTRSAFRLDFVPTTQGAGISSGPSVGIFVTNTSETSQSAELINGNTGVLSQALSTASAINIGVIGRSGSGTMAAIGVYGTAIRNPLPPFAIGVLGRAVATFGATSAIGGAFELSASGTTPQAIVTAIYGGNKAVAAPLLVLSDNDAAPPTSSATATFRVLDGANAQCGNCVLTSATMTASNQAETRGTTHSYAWTNAMVVALGATGTGDITVATLPAKTQVRNAYVVIDTPDSSANALTVSCGDAIGGAPFNNWVLAGDAKAAANTVYGDAVAERGTAIDVEFYYLPAYAATTLVTCRFTKSVTNLSTVTGSTGRVIIETVLLP